MAQNLRAIAALPLVLAVTPVAAQADEIDSGLAEASRTLEAGDFEGAAAKAHAVAARFDAQNSAAGTTYYCAHSQAETLVYAIPAKPGGQRIVVTGPDWCDALFLEAYALGELKRPAEAIKLLRRLTVLAPMRAQYRNELGYALEQVRDPDGALESYQVSRKLAAKDSPVGADPHMEAAALRGIGYALVEKGDLDGAEKAYRDSQKLEPDNPIARNELEYIAKQRPRS